MTFPLLPTTLDMADTDVMIEISKGNPRGLAWVNSLPVPPTMPGPVIWEMLQGARDKNDLRQIQRSLIPYPVYWPGATESQQAAVYIAAYRLSHGIGINDAVIAACAVLSGATLYTFNARHYRPIPQLVHAIPFVR